MFRTVVFIYSRYQISIAIQMSYLNLMLISSCIRASALHSFQSSKFYQLLIIIDTLFVLFQSQQSSAKQVAMGHCCSQQKQFMRQTYKHLNIIYKNSLPQDLTILLEKLNKKTSRCRLFSCSNCCTQLHDKVIILSDKNNKGIIHIPTSYFYYGGISNDKEEGQGIGFYQKCIFYNGQFHVGLCHGPGKLCIFDRLQNLLPLKTGKWNNGQFIQGKISPHPLCQNIRSIHLQNNEYQIIFDQQLEYRGQGELLDDNFIKNGKGKLIHHPTGYEYDGWWVNNMREGEGEGKKCVQKTKNGTFIGSFKADCKKKGVYQDNEYRYEGSWQEGKIFTGDMTHKKSNKKERFVRNKNQQS